MTSVGCKIAAVAYKRVYSKAPYWRWNCVAIPDTFRVATISAWGSHYPVFGVYRCRSMLCFIYLNSWTSKRGLPLELSFCLRTHVSFCQPPSWIFDVRWCPSALKRRVCPTIPSELELLPVSATYVKNSHGFSANAVEVPDLIHLLELPLSQCESWKSNASLVTAVDP